MTALCGVSMLLTGCTAHKEESAAQLTDYVNPLLGTATLWRTEDLGYERHRKERTWGAEAFPGATTPQGMVQATPVTMWGAGGGYQYEDTTILGFAHTAMGHWNLIDLPMLPVTGRVSADNYPSSFSHANETARPGYYRVKLDKYDVDAELTATPHAAIHRYSFPASAPKRLLVNVAHNQHPVRDWTINKEGYDAFSGKQGGLYYYAQVNLPIDTISIVQSLVERGAPVAIVDFKDNTDDRPLEVRVGLSYVSTDNARLNLFAETEGKSFDDVAAETAAKWENLLSKVNVEGGTERQKGLLYSTLYRAMLQPRLESDVNGQYRDARGEIVTDTAHNYYSNPAFWDVSRNQLILLAMLSPDKAADVIRSTIDRGEKRDGYIPSYFHGDHAPTFVIGAWKRGVRDFDLKRAYALALKSATVPGPGGRAYMDEYLEKGYVSDDNVPDNPFWVERRGGVTKTLEYAYDDYAVAQIARELGDSANYTRLASRANNYRNVFNPDGGFFQGRVADGSWLTPYNPDIPYYQHQYREANGWNSLFYAPHDPEGMIALYPSAQAVEAKLDTLFTRPYCGLEVCNMTGFIGNYCHGNQPGHNIPFTYCFIGRQDKSQQRIDQILDTMYDMGAEHLAYCGMDDAGEMSSWYVLTSLGIYTYSPADPQYIVTVPLFSKATIDLGGDTPATIVRKGDGRKIKSINVGGKPLDGWFVNHADLASGKVLEIVTE